MRSSASRAARHALAKRWALAGLLILAAAGFSWYWTSDSRVNFQFQRLRAQEAKGGCVGRRNDVYRVDGRYILYIREGFCLDNSYSYSLYDGSPTHRIIEVHDSADGRQIVGQDRPEADWLLKMVTGVGPDGIPHAVEGHGIVPVM